jgi:SAM-dependent methyltransferase
MNPETPATPADAEFHCCYATPQEALDKGRYIYGKYRDHLDRARPVVELGCGEGALLAHLRREGFSVLGVESNRELVRMAEQLGVPVVCSDILDHLRSRPAAGAPPVYLYLDVIEHVPFEYNQQLLSLIPRGARLIVQTPNTRSLRGIEMYLNVPSHVAPYSDWVLKRMLERAGFRVLAEGTVDGARPRRWRLRLARWFLGSILKLEPEMILGGGNYYVVAEKS